MKHVKESAEDRLNAFFLHLTSDLSAVHHAGKPAVERQLLRMRKRAEFINQALEPEALFKFLCTNQRMRGFNVCLPAEVANNAKLFIENALWRYHSALPGEFVQEALSFNNMFQRWRFGPGGSYGVQGTHTADKLGQSMTCTEMCEPYVRRLRACNTYLSAEDSRTGDSGTVTVYGSKMLTVPKNEDTVRTIAVEPSGNMALQLAVGSVLEGALKAIGLDKSKQQPRNKALAKRGSIDGSLATLDLSSASDSISIQLAQALLPTKLFSFLMEIRSPEVEINGESVPQYMISTMGNGFTFELMTLIISALVYANRVVFHNGPTNFIDWNITAVYGDDIIVPCCEYDSLCKMLECSGFIVNDEKSYRDGPFRESCGGDYWGGVNITPFYVKNLRFDHEIYVGINKLCLWGAKNGVYPVQSVKYLLSCLRKGPYFVPMWYPPYSGVRTTVVRPRFPHLAVITRSRAYEGPFLMMLACGGYVEDVGLGPAYTPRPKRVEVRTKVSRLPKGFLDGSGSQIWESVLTESQIDLIISLAR